MTCLYTPRVAARSKKLIIFHFLDTLGSSFDTMYTMGKPTYNTPSEKDQRSFSNYLSEDEEMVILTGISKMYVQQQFIIHFSVALAVSIVPALVGWFFLKPSVLWLVLSILLISLIYAFFRSYTLKKGIQYILTTKRVIVQRGYFNINLYSVPYNKITHIESFQNIVDRTFYKHGKVIIRIAGSENKDLTMSYIESPFEFKNILENLIRRDKSTAPVGESI